METIGLLRDHLDCIGPKFVMESNRFSNNLKDLLCNPVIVFHPNWNSYDCIVIPISY